MKNLPFAFLKNKANLKLYFTEPSIFLWFSLSWPGFAKLLHRPTLVAVELFCRSGQICLKYCNIATDATQSDTTHYVH
jgi:hypothetical protein